MEDLGWVEDQNIVIEWRFVGGRAERLPGLAARGSSLGPALHVARPLPVRPLRFDHSGTLWQDHDVGGFIRAVPGPAVTENGSRIVHFPGAVRGGVAANSGEGKTGTSRAQ